MKNNYMATTNCFKKGLLVLALAFGLESFAQANALDEARTICKAFAPHIIYVPLNKMCEKLKNSTSMWDIPDFLGTISATLEYLSTGTVPSFVVEENYKAWSLIPKEEFANLVDLAINFSKEFGHGLRINEFQNLKPPSIQEVQDLADVPIKIRETLDQHAQEISRFLSSLEGRQLWGGAGVKRFEWLPGIFLKYGIERYFNAKMLKWFIEENHIKTFSVPVKYLYHIPGRPYELESANYLVVVPINPEFHDETRDRPYSSMTTEQRSELGKVKTVYSGGEFHPRNYQVNQEGKILIIDTDATAMPFSWQNFEAAKERHLKWMKERD